MTDKNLFRISDLCLDFKSAAINSLEIQSSEIQEKYLASIDSVEMEKIQTLQEELENEIDTFSKKSVLPQFPDSFLKKNLEMCEMIADICLRVIPSETVSHFIPKELKNQADADTLRSLGAPKLASLCEFKK
jgi:hypothetical protein